MKRFNYYLSLMLLLVFTAACSDEFDQPPMVVPVAEHTANISIAEFKAKHWQDDKNYIDTIKDDEVIHGWITSSDEEGNIFKQLYISDGTAGLTISIDQSSLYTKYRIGQEVVIPMKGYFIGKFNGLLCLGEPYYWEGGSAWESNRMPMEMWESMAEINGFPDLAKVDTTVIEISDLKNTDSQTLLKYMSRLVRINGVTFTEGGKVFSESDASSDREIIDEEDNALTVRNSSYASFRANILPKGTVDVVGLVSYTSGDGFFLLLRSASDVITDPSHGTKSQPYTVEEAMAIQNSKIQGWVGGYAVGAVGPEVTTVTSNADIEWMAPTTLPNTLVLADDPECKDISKCVIVPLAQGSQFRTDANLMDNKAVYKSFVKVKGDLVNYMGHAGVDTITNYVLDIAYTKFREEFTTSIPSSWTNIKLSGTNKWEQYDYNDDHYARMTGFKGKNPPFDAWLITPKMDIKKAKSKVFSFDSQVNNYGSIVLEVYLLDSNNPNDATVKVQLFPTLAKTPTSGAYSGWVPSGEIDLSQWSDGSYYIGFRYYAENDPDNNYTTWCIDNVSFGMGATGGKSDFETMGSATTTLGNYTSTAGWVATNCMLLDGQDGVSPHFPFIGYALGSTSTYAVAPTLTGNTSSVGKIVSPTLKGGMTQLTFKYGYAFSGQVLAFRVDVKQNGAVVNSWEVRDENVEQKKAYTFEKDCSINGDFTIEITNLCPSNSASNRDRLSIWNVNWQQD